MKRLTFIAALAACIVLPAISANAADKPPAKVAVCGACHGTNGIARLPMFPNLAGQYDSYLKRALHDYKDGIRNNAIMNAQAANLSNEDIDQLAAWYSSRPAKVYTPSVTEPFVPKTPKAASKAGGDAKNG